MDALLSRHTITIINRCCKILSHAASVIYNQLSFDCREILHVRKLNNMKSETLHHYVEESNVSLSQRIS